MAHTFSASEYNQLVAASQFMTLASATELPFDEAVINRLGKVAVSSGFAANLGAWQEACKLNPISTLINFTAFIGKA